LFEIHAQEEVKLEMMPVPIRPGVARAFAQAVLSRDVTHCKPFELSQPFQVVKQKQGLEGMGFTLLETLKLNGCRLGDVGVAAISLMLADESEVRIKAIELHDNDIGLDGCIALGDALAFNYYLESLSLRDNRTLGSRPAQALIRPLTVKAKKMKGLTNLSFANCNVGALACDNLSKLLAIPATLTNLDLSGNNIGAEGVNRLCNGLALSKTLTSLNIRECGIGFLATVHPAIEFGQPDDDQEISHRLRTPLGQVPPDKKVKDTLSTLCDVLLTNKTIVHLDMENNGIREDPMKRMLPAVESGHLQTLKVDVTLPEALYAQMYKVAPPPKAGKKGKKGKKKK
jgi:hypothetical protein